VVLTTLAWIFWSVLRAVGAPRTVSAPSRPPLCEFCGYNLTGADLAGRCSECGMHVADSLGPNARPGVIWESRRQVGNWQAWWRCTLDAVLRPTWFGRQLRVTPANSAHRLFLGLNLLLIAILSMLGIPFIRVVRTGRLPGMEQERATLAIGLTIAGFMAAGAVLLLALAAGGHGAGGRRRAGRNLMSISMQMGSYLSGFLVLWTLVLVAWSLALTVLEPLFLDFLDGRRLRFGASAALVRLLPYIVGLAIYYVGLSRATTAARYANR
jgi:hypothetical protein